VLGARSYYVDKYSSADCRHQPSVDTLHQYLLSKTVDLTVTANVTRHQVKDVNLPYEGTKADVWSAGVMLFIMLLGGMPFDQKPDGIAAYKVNYIQLSTLFQCELAKQQSHSVCNFARPQVCAMQLR
jgi:serine/threonine protein kinase